MSVSVTATTLENDACKWDLLGAPVYGGKRPFGDPWYEVRAVATTKGRAYPPRRVTLHIDAPTYFAWLVASAGQS